MTYRLLLITAMLCVVALPATPHSGGTNADGCHNGGSRPDHGPPVSAFNFALILISFPSRHTETVISLPAW